MSESLEGVRVAMTRQNAGKPWKMAMFGWKGPGAAGGVKAPAATLSAEVMETFGRRSLERFSQAGPPVGAAIIMTGSAAGSRASAAIRNPGANLNMGTLLWFFIR